jgi:hypothetical protein
MAWEFDCVRPFGLEHEADAFKFTRKPVTRSRRVPQRRCPPAVLLPRFALINSRTMVVTVRSFFRGKTAVTSQQHVPVRYLSPTGGTRWHLFRYFWLQLESVVRRLSLSIGRR